MKENKKDDETILYELYQNEIAIKTSITEKTIRLIEKKQKSKYEIVKKIIIISIFSFFVSILLVTMTFMKDIVKKQRESSQDYSNTYNTNSHTFVSENVFEKLNN